MLEADKVELVDPPCASGCPCQVASEMVMAGGRMFSWVAVSLVEKLAGVY